MLSIHQGHTPSLPPADVRVVIDVIRAFTTTHVALGNGALCVLLAGELDEARRLAAAAPGRILAGERNAIAPPDFDLGNSPAAVAKTDLEGRELVLTTSHGVQAVVHAAHDGPLVVTGFSNAGATLRYLKERLDGGAQSIQLIASHPESDDDMACAQWIRARLQGHSEPTDEDVIERICQCSSAQKFLTPKPPSYVAEDLDYCARRQDAPWAMVVTANEESLVVERNQ